jgi:hypothetical protein
MRKLIALVAAAFLFSVGQPAFDAVAKSGSTSVQGYTKKDGTYVAPHVRTTPNNSKYDNWSTKGNANPYTGKPGTKDPYELRPRR